MTTLADDVRDVLQGAIEYAVGKHLAGIEDTLTVDMLVDWVKDCRCPDEEWRGTVRELLWEMDPIEFSGLLWHPELTPKQVGDFVRYAEGHLSVFPDRGPPNEALVNLLQLALPDEDWPETPDDTDLEWRRRSESDWGRYW